MSKVIFAGVDGCRGGWFGVFLSADDWEKCEWKIGVFKTFSSLVDQIIKEYNSSEFLIMVDMPIGLKEGNNGPRLSDLEARKLLKARKSSIFPVPCREAAYAEDYKKACEVNEKLTGTRISKQAWNILPKIRDLDTFLIEEEIFREKIKEISPEICFQEFKGLPMKYSKKTQEGFLERKKVLETFCPFVDDLIKTALLKYKRQELAKDDILDAFIGAVTAKYGYRFGFEYAPCKPEMDKKGLKIQLVYCIPKIKDLN